VIKKGFAFLVVLATLGAIGWKAYEKAQQKRKGAERKQRQAVTAIEMAPVKKATIRDVATFSGTLSARSQFLVAPKVIGRLEKLMVDIGDKVAKGQLIAVLDSQEYEQQVERARAELDVAKAKVAESFSAMDVAKRELERRRTLREEKVTSEAELDEADARFKVNEARYKVSQAEVAQKEAALRTAQIQLSYTQIGVSWDEGDESRVVGERLVDQGAMLRANEPIVSVLDIRSVKAVIHIIERDYSKVVPGQEAALTTDAFPSTKFTGKVSRVAPILKEASRQARVEIEIPNPERLLKPGMFVRAFIEFDRHENATVVPLAALVRRNGRQGVFLVDTQAAQVRFIPAKIGIMDGDWAEVVEPALSGEVATLGQHLLEDGATVLLPQPPSAAKSPQPGGKSKP